MSMWVRVSAWAVTAVLAAAAVASSQSLAEVARREQERRKAIKSASKIYTNDDLRAPRGAPSPASAAESASKPTSGQASQQPAAQPTAPPSEPEEPESAKTEAYWRDRITAARQQLARQQLFLDALQSRVNALWADFTARDDPAQRSVLEQDRQKALAEMERVRAEIEQSTQEIAAIEEEARRAGVPPGWLR